MSPEIKIGDYVEVDIGMGLAAIGVVVTEDQYQVAMQAQRNPHSPVTTNWSKINGFKHISRGVDSAYRIKFIDESTHTALASECRKLSDKEVFKAKLSDDKRIYEI